MTISPTAPTTPLLPGTAGDASVPGTPAPDFLAVIQAAMSEAAPAKAVEQLVAGLPQEEQEPAPDLVAIATSLVAEPAPRVVDEGRPGLSRNPVTAAQTAPTAPGFETVAAQPPQPAEASQPEPTLAPNVPPALAALVAQYVAPTAPVQQQQQQQPGKTDSKPDTTPSPTPELAVAGTEAPQRGAEAALPAAAAPPARTVPVPAHQQDRQDRPEHLPEHRAVPATPAVPASHEKGEPATPATPATPAAPHAAAEPVTLPTSLPAPVPVSTPATAPVAAAAPVSTPDLPQPAAPLDRVAAQVFPEVTGLVSRGNGTHRISLTLNPDGLGEVRVVMAVRDGAVHVRLAAGHEARTSLADGSAELTRLLEHAGATEARVVVRELPAAPAVAATTSSAPTTDTTGTPFQAGPGRERSPDQHARTRGDHPARDGSDTSTPRPAGAPVQPVTGTRAAGVDLTM